MHLVVVQHENALTGSWTGESLLPACSPQGVSSGSKVPATSCRQMQFAEVVRLQTLPETAGRRKQARWTIERRIVAQTYYKLSYVDRRVDNPEQRICEDIPKLCNGLGDLVGEWTKCAVDAVFYSWVLRSYTRTNKYTAIIIAYVFGAGAMTVSVSPNFAKLFKTQAGNEGVQQPLRTVEAS